jgi:hypothetical protein
MSDTIINGTEFNCENIKKMNEYLPEWGNIIQNRQPYPHNDILQVFASYGLITLQKISS